MKTREKKRMRQRLLSWLMTVTVFVTTVLTGWAPMTAFAEERGVTLTVIGDTGDHGMNPEEHTGYIYWLKDRPLDIKLNELEDMYIAKNCTDSILAALNEAGIANDCDNPTLYPTEMGKDGVTLSSSYPTGWSVIVAYEDGTFSSDGWGEYQGAAELKPGCRLIYYWSDDSSTDCRLSTDDNYRTQLNYDTDAVTGIQLFLPEEPDQAVSSVDAAVGKPVALNVKYTVPQGSAVSREVECRSDNASVADVENQTAGDDPKIMITPKASGEANVTVSMTNTLGDLVEAKVRVKVTADGTTITGMNFQEGGTLELKPGEKKILTPVFTPELSEGETAPVPKWTSSKPEVASVDAASGEITALIPGETEITAVITNNQGAEVKASCAVTVASVPAEGILLDQDTLDLNVGDTAQINARFTPDNATEFPQLTWSSENDQIASVKGEGTQAVITAVKGGMTRITVSGNGLSASCEVTVTGSQQQEAMLEDIQFSRTEGGDGGYEVKSPLDPEKKECTILVSEKETEFYVKPVLRNGLEGASLSVTYTSTRDSKEVTEKLENGQYTRLSKNPLKRAADNTADLKVNITAGEQTEEYVVHVVRETVVSKIDLADQDGNTLYYTPKFDTNIREYKVNVLDTVTAVHMDLSAYDKDSVLTVNGEKAEGKKFDLPITKDSTQALIRAEQEGIDAAVYTLTINRVKAAGLTVTVDPADAVVAVYNNKGDRIWEKDGVYPLMPGEEYTYTVTKAGYISQFGTLMIEGADSRSFKLEKAPETQLPDLDADWPGFRRDPSNQAITESQTPTDRNSVDLKWETQFGKYTTSSAPATPIIVDDKIYTYSGDQLLMLDKKTGEMLKQTKMAGRSSFAINPPAYGDGMIFVALTGKIQAFNAKTLESLWIYTDRLGGQPNCTVRYDDGYLYTGYWTGRKGGNMVCIPVTDEDPAQPLEEKMAAWTMFDRGGFYWAGSWTNEKYVMVGSDLGLLYCLDKRSGEVVQKIDTNELTGNTTAEIRSDISYYKNRIYFTSKGGWLFSYNLKEDGTIDTEHVIQPLKLGNMSTSTPLVYNGRAYVGVTDGGNFDGTYGIQVVDVDEATGALAKAYRLETDGYPQTSGVMSTGYVDQDGYVYIYFLTNSPRGTLYVVKDKKGLTQADPASGELYIPNHEQYCISGIAVDSEGTLYFKNDSAWMMALGKADLYLTDVKVSGGNAVLDGGAAFNGAKDSHVIQADAGTETIHLEVTASADTEVSINETAGTAQDITLKDGQAKAEVRLSKGASVRAYTFYVTTESALSKLTVTTIRNGEEEGKLNFRPAFDPLTENYTVENPDKVQTLYLWATAAGSEDIVKATAISGVKGKAEGEELRKNQGNVKSGWRVEPENADTPAKVKVTVTDKDGSRIKEYVLSIGGEAAGLPGDLNGDGILTMADAEVLLNEIAEGAGADLGIADLNGDGEISMADVELLLSRIQEQE